MTPCFGEQIIAWLFHTTYIPEIYAELTNKEIIAFNIRNLKRSIGSKNNYKSHYYYATTLLSTWLKAKMVNSVKETF